MYLKVWNNNTILVEIMALNNSIIASQSDYLNYIGHEINMIYITRVFFGVQLSL